MNTIFENFFLSGARNLTTENRRRIILLNGILLAGFIALASAGASAYFVRKNYPLATADGLFALIALTMIVALRRSLRIRIISTVLCLLMLLLFTFLVVTGGDQNTGPLWLFIYPLLSYFLVGGRTAIWLNVAMLTAAFAILMVPELALVKYETAFKGRFLGSFAVLSGITYVFEYSRADAEKKMLLAQKEGDDIFGSIREGLFLITPESGRLTLGSRFSTATQTLLEEPYPSGKQFSEILRKIKPDADISAIEKYLALYFRPELDPAMLAEINPLKLVEGTRALSFSFHRIATMDFRSRESAGVESLMCAVTDKTDEVALQRQLKAQEEKQANQMSLLLEILHANPAMLAEFLHNASTCEQDISHAFQQADVATAELLEDTYRKMHTIKGDARALGLQYTGELVHNLEEEIARLKRLSRPQGQDMLKLTVGLAGLRTHLAEFTELLEKIRSHAAVSEVTSQTPITDQAFAIARQLIKSTGKNVAIDATNFNESLMPLGFSRRIREIITQLIRNSFAHGIEPTEQRLSQGKPETAKILLSARGENGRIELRYADDGCGLDAAKIRERAIAQGIVTSAEIAGWDDKRILGLIFKQGFSTTEEADADSGRGVGMDIIRQHVRDLGGQIRLATKPKKGVEFVFEFPVEQTKTG